MPAFERCRVRVFGLFKRSIFVLSFMAFAMVASRQTTLSPNSGINSQDTYVIFDLSVQTAATITSPSVLNVNPSATYDACRGRL